MESARLPAAALAVALALVAGAMILGVATSVKDDPVCSAAGHEVRIPDDGECFDGSSGRQDATAALAWAGGIAAALAAILAGLWAFTGVLRRPLMPLAVAGVSLSLLALVVGAL